MSSGDVDAPTGLIIIRLWRGDDGPRDLRARLTLKVDVNAEATEYGSASTVEGVSAQVQTWAAAFLSLHPDNA
jgi:hypothetical protein